MRTHFSDAEHQISVVSASASFLN